MSEEAAHDKKVWCAIAPPPTLEEKRRQTPPNVSSSNPGDLYQRRFDRNPYFKHKALPKSLSTPANYSATGSWLPDLDATMSNIFAIVLKTTAYVLVIFTFPLSLLICLKVAQEYERIVIFRLGKLLAGGARGPGLFFILPCIDSYRKIDLRTVTYDVPPQEILSKDSVTVSVDAVVYFRTSNPILSVTNVNDAFYSTKLLTQTTLRNVLGTKTLAEMLSDREQIAAQAQHSLDEGTGPWGIKVERIEVKDIRLPQQLTRAMAAEAEATREARAKVIAAEGEQKASRALKEAATVLSECGTAIQLRYLQTLSNIAAEHNSTIVFPVPVNMFSELLPKKNQN